MPSIYITSDKPRSGKTALAVTLKRKIEGQGKKVSLIVPFSDGKENSTLESVVGIVKTEGKDSDINIIEGLGDLDNNSGDLSRQLVESIDAKVILVLGYSPSLYSGVALRAQMLFGDRLAGVVINGVTIYKQKRAIGNLIDELEGQGVKILATIPEDRKLLGVTVGELAEHIGGTFLYGEHKKDLFIDNFMIGGLVLDWGVLYFERHENKAVIVRGNRPDLQMAALSTPTSCVVLTGTGSEGAIEYVQIEAEEEEIPLICVETNTLDTVGVLEELQDRTEFNHTVKEERFLELLDENGDWPSILAIAEV